jgi:diketogulonate reductase-like aldo/keto reductase
MSEKDSIEMPRFVYGTAWKEENTARLVKTAVEAGFVGIDTANQPRHYNESLVGEALAELATQGMTRDKLFVQTKFTPLDGHDQRVPYDSSASLSEQVKQSFARSLENLQTGIVDSYLLHGPYSYMGLGESDWEVWKAMEEIYKNGQARKIGISNVHIGHLKDLAENAEVKPMVVQNRCFAAQGWDRTVREFCREFNIIYQGFSLLTANGFVLQDPEVRGIAGRLDKTPAQVIFRFAMQVGMAPLTGTTSQEHMKEDLQALDSFELSHDEVHIIEAIAKKYK